MAGHFALSKSQGGNFTYEWFSDPSCPDIFSSLFISSLVYESNASQRASNKDTLFITHNSRPTNCGSHLDDIFKAYICLGIKLNDLSRYNDEFYSHLFPNQRILNQVRDLQLNSISSLLGVHIRRTDMIDHCLFKGLEPPCDDDILFAIDSYLQKKPDSMIFLSADNPESEHLIQTKFFQKVIIQKKDWNLSKSDTSKSVLIQDRMSSLEEAVIDLYALSICTFIIGTKHSSFSTFAAKWGKKEYIRV